MKRVFYTVIAEIGMYFDSAFGNFLPEEEEIVQIANVTTMEEFERRYSYERILKVEEVLKTDPICQQDGELEDRIYNALVDMIQDKEKVHTIMQGRLYDAEKFINIDELLISGKIVPAEKSPNNISTTTFICQLPSETQKRLRNAIKDVISTFYEGNYFIDEMVNNAMSGRLCDLEADLDIPYFLETGNIRPMEG